MSRTVVSVEKLGKKYKIGSIQGRYKTLRESIMSVVRNPFRPRREHQFLIRNHGEIIWALRDVSFEAKEGEVIGIIGRNGAGKSTLLKILSRITEPTEGRAIIRGRVGSMLEVGTGFHPELTGRENIYLNGAILGMTRSEIGRKFDKIVSFAEIEKFLDTPVKHYSSGMYVRLAFAVAAHLEPEILIVDEVLAVGDATFQKKCLGKMEGAAKEGRTVLFVSHNIQAVRALCGRGILLEQGSVCKEGPVSEVIDRYMTEDFGPPKTHAIFQEDPDLRIQFLEAELVSHLSKEEHETQLFKCTYVVRQELQNVLLCVGIRNAADVSVFYSNDESLTDGRKRKVGVHSVSLLIPSYLFSPGEYVVAFGFWEPGHSPEHFPQVRLAIRREEPNTRLSAHGISWPSVIYMPSTWNYISTEV